MGSVGSVWLLQGAIYMRGAMRIFKYTTLEQLTKEQNTYIHTFKKIFLTSPPRKKYTEMTLRLEAWRAQSALEGKPKRCPSRVHPLCFWSRLEPCPLLVLLCLGCIVPLQLFLLILFYCRVPGTLNRKEFFCTLSLSWALGNPSVLDG